MSINFKIKDGRVVLVDIAFDDNEELTGLDGKKIVRDYLDEQLTNK